MTMIYTVNLSKIHGTGDFPCPKCKSFISPDDVEEKSYKILFVTLEEETAKEILIECNTCHSRINIVGFESTSRKGDKTRPVPPKGKLDEQILRLLQDGANLSLNEIAEALGKNPKAIFKVLRKLFEQEKIACDYKNRKYEISKNTSQ